MVSMYKSDITKIDNDKLKLRYVLGGLIQEGKSQPCPRYWSCDVKCSAFPVSEDENLIKVENFIKKHNLDIVSFLEITYCYLRDGFYGFHGEYGPLIDELEKVMEGYNFKRLHKDQIEQREVIFKDGEILALLKKIKNDENSELYQFLKEYNLTDTDFIVLTKTRLNYAFYVCYGFDESEFYKKLTYIIRNNISWEYYDVVDKLRKTGKTMISGYDLETTSSDEFDEQLDTITSGNHIKNKMKRFRSRY